MTAEEFEERLKKGEYPVWKEAQLYVPKSDEHSEGFKKPWCCRYCFKLFPKITLHSTSIENCL